MVDHPDAHELCVALETELRDLAGVAPSEFRMRLLVAAHAAALLAREDGVARESDDPQLAVALRNGAHDADLPAVARRLRAEVAARLNIVSPGYGQGD
jgi:hypothetical protein